jgi:hypothetical protein
LDGDVLNGGFNQYLFNSPDFAQDAPAALREFGLDDAAALADKALEYFRAGVQKRHAAARDAGTVEAFMRLIRTAVRRIGHGVLRWSGELASGSHFIHQNAS